MMKTDGLADDFEKLDIFQAYEALAAGKCVRPVLYGFTHKWENGVLYYWGDQGTKMITPDFYKGIGMLFRVVPDPSIPESKSLTFEQVVALGQNAKVVIEGPFGNIPHLIGVAADLLLVDLAERRGWPVYEANG